jgi:hypothetical protein
MAKKKSGRPNEERKANELLAKVLKQKAAMGESPTRTSAQPAGKVVREAED